MGVSSAAPWRGGLVCLFREAWSGGRLRRALLFALSSVCLNALVCFGKCFVLKSTHLWIWVALQGGVTTSFLHHPLPLASARRGWSVGTLTRCPDSCHPSPADPCPTLSSLRAVPVTYFTHTHLVLAHTLPASA